MLSPGEILDDKYKIIRQLGSGGQAQVFLADDIWLNTKVIVKIAKVNPKNKRYIRQIRERFHREARVHFMLRHQNLAAFRDFGMCAEDGKLYLVMSYIDGVSLSDKYRRNTTSKFSACMDEKTALEFARQILGCLELIHSKGLIHRDIKPANIVVDESTKSCPCYILIDFGLVKILEPSAVSDPQLTKGFVGTAHFAAPEQANPKKFGEVSERTDIFSFAACLYRLLCGKRAIGNIYNEQRKSYRQIVAGNYEIKPLEKRQACGFNYYSSKFAKAVMRGLEFNPADRPNSAMEFFSLLREASESNSTQTGVQSSQSKDVALSNLIEVNRNLEGDLKKTTAQLHSLKSALIAYNSLSEKFTALSKSLEQHISNPGLQ